MKGIARGWRGLPWAQALLVALSVGLAGCSCFVSELELELEPQGGCVLGTMCPDGSCVLPVAPSWGGVCCGFGGECDPCPFGGFECPDGTCAVSSAACCSHGGSCDPGDDAGEGDPHREPGSTGGETEGAGSSEEGGSSEDGGSSEGSSEGASSDTDDASTTTGGDTAATSGSTG